MSKVTIPAKSICTECVMTWLLYGDGAVCLYCQLPVVWRGDVSPSGKERGE